MMHIRCPNMLDSSPPVLSTPCHRSARRVLFHPDSHPKPHSDFLTDSLKSRLPTLRRLLPLVVPFHSGSLRIRAKRLGISLLTGFR